jgi:hypothetical protein
MAFYPKDPRIKSVFDRLTLERACETDYEIAKQLSKYKEIRESRRQENIFIGMDRKMGKSVIFAKKPIKKKGNNGFIL